MNKPGTLQQTREFSGMQAAIHFVRDLRKIWGRKAKCTIRTHNGQTLVHYNVPNDKHTVPNRGKLIEEPQPLKGRFTRWSARD